MHCSDHYQQAYGQRKRPSCHSTRAQQLPTCKPQLRQLRVAWQCPPATSASSRHSSHFAPSPVCLQAAFASAAAAPACCCEGAVAAARCDCATAADTSFSPDTTSPMLQGGGRWGVVATRVEQNAGISAAPCNSSRACACHALVSSIAQAPSQAHNRLTCAAVCAAAESRLPAAARLKGRGEGQHTNSQRHQHGMA